MVSEQKPHFKNFFFVFILASELCLCGTLSFLGQEVNSFAEPRIKKLLSRASNL